MQLAVHDADGKQVRRITVDESVFGITPNLAVLHQAFVAQRANQRRGSASTKSRGEVQGSTRKIRGQKYSGRARQGSNRSPVRVGGGVAFGPRPRSYSQALPKKMKRLAIRSALSGKVADDQFHIVDRMEFSSPQTKEMIRVLRNVGIERSALIVTDEPDRTVLVSARNLQKTKVLPAAYLNVVDLLNHRDLLLTESAVRRVEGMWGAQAGKPAAKEAPKPRRRRAAAAEKPTAEAAPETEKKPRRRAAAPAEKPTAEAAPETEKKPPRRRAAASAAAAAPETEKKPARRTKRPSAAEKKPSRPTSRPSAKAKKETAAQADAAPKRTRRSRAKKAEEG